MSYVVLVGTTFSEIEGGLPYSQAVVIDSLNWKTPDDFFEQIKVCVKLIYTHIDNYLGHTSDKTKYHWAVKESPLFDFPITEGEYSTLNKLAASMQRKESERVGTYMDVPGGLKENRMAKMNTIRDGGRENELINIGIRDPKVEWTEDGSISTTMRREDFDWLMKYIDHARSKGLSVRRGW